MTRLEALSWVQAREHLARGPVVLVPVGSTEQHGPHLPLGTDFMTARHLASGAAAEAGALCAPTVAVGISDHHRQFWGTLTVPPDAFRAYVLGIARSLAGHGVRRMVFVNGHGGNGPALGEVCRALRRDSVYALTWKWWTCPPVRAAMERLFESRGSHAGATETAAMWAIAPELVHPDQFEAAAAGAPEVFGASLHGATLTQDTIDFSASGATLDPREASPEAGAELMATATAELVALVEWLAAADEETLAAQGHL